MKIGFVIDDGLDKPDGVQQYVLTLGSWLQSQGHRVRYLAGETHRGDIPELRVLTKNLAVRYNANKLSTPLPAFGQKIRRTLAAEKFDVLHVQMPYSPFLAARVVRAASEHTAVVGTFHLLPYRRSHRHGTRLLGLSLKRNLRRFDGFISVSRPAQVFAKQTFGIESQVVPNPVDIYKYHSPTPNPEGTRPRLVFLGRLVERKGCRQLLLALIELLAKYKPQNLELIVCGDGSQRASLEHLVTQNRLGHIVKFVGFVTEKRKINYLQSADIAIFPSLGGESFGIVLIEAMAAGAGVVLGGNNPGYTSVLGPVPETLFDPHDPAQLASILSNLLSNPAEAKKIHNAQQQLVRHYDIQVVGPQVLNIYKDCITTKKQG